MRWARYVAGLTWRRGHLDQSSWHASLRGASLGLPQDDVFDTLLRLITEAGDTPKPEKIQSQIERAYAFVEAGGQGPNQSTTGADPLRAPAKPHHPLKPAYEPSTLGKVAARVDVADMVEFVMRKSSSTPAYIRSGDYLDSVYPTGERVLILTRYESQGQMVWQREVTPAHELPTGGPDGVWFLPNPIDGKWHPNPRNQGKPSRRSQEAVTAFRYAVLESDEAAAGDWLKLLVQLPLPIESICESGGRSIHVLIRVDAQTKTVWDSIVTPAKPYLTRLGADPGALSAVRLSRLPQAFRGDRQQRLLYVNPNATPTPIINLADRPLWRDWLDWGELVIRADLQAHHDDLRLCIQNLDTATQSLRTACAIHFLRLRGGGA